MSLGSTRVKLDLLRHTARASGPKAALRLILWFLKDYLGSKRAALVYPHVEWGQGVLIKGPLEIRGWGTLVIGDNVVFDNWSGSPNIISLPSPDAKIVIEDECHFNGTTIIAKESVRIGRHAYIGVCQISDSDFHGIAADERDTPGVVRPIVIEENVWVCPGAQIMRGVTIGRDSVIGAGAVVRRDVPPGKIMIGNPAEEVGVVPNSAGTGHA